MHASQQGCSYLTCGSVHSSVAGCTVDHIGSLDCWLAGSLARSSIHPTTHSLTLSCNAELEEQLEAQQGDARPTQAAADVHAVPQTVCVLSRSKDLCLRASNARSSSCPNLWSCGCFEVHCFRYDETDRTVAVLPVYCRLVLHIVL